MKNFKSGFVTLIGRPNVGKSTLMNRLIGQKIAITSNKPQTTRNRIQTVYTCEEGQIIFLDTPGIHKAKNKLGEYMVTVAERTLKEVDVIHVLSQLIFRHRHHGWWSPPPLSVPENGILRSSCGIRILR